MLEDPPFRVPVVCAWNPARSQMAPRPAAIPGRLTVRAGERRQPAKEVHALAVSIMADSGFDASSYTSDHQGCYVADDFDPVATVCDFARECCLGLPGGARLFHHPFEDPDQPGLNDAALTDIFRPVRGGIGEFPAALWSEGV